MANKRITDVDFIESLHSDESFFVNQNNAIKQINKKNIIFNVANGGTGATTADDARMNLGAVAMKSATIVIPVDIWEQNDAYGNLYYANMNGSAPYVDVDGKANVFISPAQTPIDNYNAFIENGVRACEQGFETIGFVADAKPNVAITINYVVFV